MVIEAIIGDFMKLNGFDKHQCCKESINLASACISLIDKIKTIAVSQFRTDASHEVPIKRYYFLSGAQLSYRCAFDENAI